MADSSVNTTIKVLSILLIIGGLAVYIGWGIAYGSWNFFEPKYIPIYGLTVVMVLFGLLGLALTRLRD
ncbi:MAG TPA: hypothetical protein PLI21_03305 [Methanomassiliicoccaceae archaeon]|jgi:hypothetical protein|nr:hypothetical protein [Euryarchaeota archaeon]HOB37658.1 hypothetical protein [Methanomassiliicoccaceae archaeon]HOK28032.1 hypothetical protein [Methanomassiliicoccaceae archaeon]HOL07500.1 hypothetical protein [Methanomassiliicoccaceae archaeon]HOQ25611.1 hypothetical protein [Methanomassiliicoccaceae archaeon]